MTKNDGYLLIGLPNNTNFNSLLSLIFLSQRRALKRSKQILENYHKASDHINGWDPYLFITLLATCVFELVKYLPTEGTPLFSQLSRIPMIGKYIHSFPFTTRLSYTMFFLARKVRDVEIGNNE